jgi:hypothetical protein
VPVCLAQDCHLIEVVELDHVDLNGLKMADFVPEELVEVLVDFQSYHCCSWEIEDFEEDSSWDRFGG